MKLISGCSIVLGITGCLWLEFNAGTLAQDTPLSNQDLPQAVPDLIEETLPTPSDLRPQETIVPESLPESELEVDSDLDEPVDVDDLPADSLQGPSFVVQSINVLGSTVLTDEIRAITSTYENREITLDDLFVLRTELTELYIKKGYINSGAFLPANQDLTDGTIDIQIVEGIIESLEITGLHHVKKFYVRDRVSLGISSPFNQNELEEALQLLQLDPLFDRVDAQLLEGSAPGKGILNLKMTEANNVQVGISVNNYRSPSIGSEQINPYLSYTNLFGIGDRFTASYSFSRGLDTYDLGYTIPVNPTGGELDFRFSRGDSDIVQDDFAQLGIRSETFNLSAGFQQPLIRTPTTELSLGLAFDIRESRTFLLEDIPFSFSSGPDDGKSRVSVIRFSQNWVDRAPDRVLAARSQFSFGIDAFDATVNEIGTDGRFFSWLGQLQWVQRLPSSNNILVTRLSTQLTPDSLLPLEQFSLGGISTVRGYRDNQLVTDNGVVGSLELRIPLFEDRTQLQFTPFIEGGLGWNNRDSSSAETLASVGVGLQWQIAERLGIRIDYGYPLIEGEDLGDSLQDSGIYFSINTELIPSRREEELSQRSQRTRHLFR